MLSALQNSGVVALWIAAGAYLFLARGDSVKLALAAMVALMAAQITLYRPSVQAPLYDAFSGHVVFLVVHLISVSEAAAILYLLVAGSGRHRFRWYAASMSVVAAVAMVGIYVAARPSEPTVSVPPEPLPLSYWYVLSVFHSLAHAAAAGLCWRSARLVGKWPVRISLGVLGAGLLLVCVPWVLTVQWLLTGDETWLSSIAKIDAVIGWCLALSVGPLLAASVRSNVLDRRTVQRLEPLWRELTSLAPGVVLQQRTIAARPRYELFRTVVEIRDAMLQLRSYVSPHALELARTYVRDQSLPDAQVRAAVTACWVAAALDGKARDTAPQPQQADIAGPGGADIDEESRHLSEISELYFSPLMDGYRRLLLADEGVR